jgi:uncharacterized membrane protein YcfT
MNLRALLRSGAIADQATRPAGAKGPRTIWADAAKGLCILLVVSWHVIMKHYLQIDWHLSVPLPGAWGFFGDQLLPMRMPLFFTISGMFAVGAVNRPWKVVARTKIAKFIYLYVLWLMIHSAILYALPVEFDTLHAHRWLDLLEQLTITPTNLWYLYALAAYFVVSKLLRKAPMAPVLFAALMLSTISAAGWLDVPGNRAGLYQNLFFFLCGLYFRPHVESLATRTSWLRVGVTGFGYAAILGVLHFFDVKQTPGVWPLASMLATVFGVTVMAKVSQWAALGNLLATLGRQTLPIYIIHMPVVATIHWLLIGPLSAAPSAVQLVVALVEPIVLTAGVTAFCLGLHSLLQRARAGWLFDLPGGTTPAAPAPPAPAEEGAVTVAVPEVVASDRTSTVYRSSVSG